MTARQQAEEGLRRARTDDSIRAGLTWTADRLSAKAGDRDPANPVSVFALRSIARGWAVQLYDWDEQAEQVFRLLWDAMPEPYPDETRGEYAVRIRPTGGTTR
ncbi:hypothetical protein [Streptomyces subrutilus]|uniref:hypothetical protein n=1 Tax=Streptomyces subrutilus TaxID=36818 RepID=UPI002E12FD4C|nr:hypothetical protein OG479_32880 [Streptomyces subrutilus]